MSPVAKGALLPAPGKEALCRRVATTWPVGPRLDELIHRARRFRKWKGDALDVPRDIPSKGYGSLPYCDAEQNPNLVRVFIDAQHDYLHDRTSMLGALIVACEGGVPARRRSIVHLAGGPPDTPEKERALLAAWIEETLRAIVELAAPDAEGQARAPIHLIFFNSFEQRLLLEALSRHLTALLGAAPALYDFMTQLAAFDSPIATFLDAETRELKNYSMTCQSLQAVAAYLKFDWNTPERYTDLFRERLFDYWGKFDGEEETRSQEETVGPVSLSPCLPVSPSPWYAARSRFASQIPLEYAYAAWGELPDPVPGERDTFAPYRRVTPDVLRRFHARRLEAMEWIAADFPGNRLTQKTPFALPDLAAFSDRARTLAQALDEFLTIERHAELSSWKTARHAPPERRVLMGETLLVRYVEADQEPEAAARNRENARRQSLRQQYEAAARQAQPDVARPQLTPEQRGECRWSAAGLRLRLRLETEGLDCTLDEAMALCTLKEGDRVVVNRRWTTDERRPAEGQEPFTPTPKQMLYGTRADLVRLQWERDAAGSVTAGWVEIRFAPPMNAQNARGFLFGSFDRPLHDGERYTLDPCPNSIYGFWCAKVTEGLQEIEAGRRQGQNTLYERIARPPGPLPDWTAAAAEAQQQFLAGLEALHAAGALHDFEDAKRDFIARCGDAPLLLVQGPPGTGKSYTTAFALFARMQGAMAAGRDYRAFVACKTHAATDVLLQNIRDVRDLLHTLQAEHPAIFARHFDPRLLDAPLYRIAPREAPSDGIIPLTRDDDKAKGERKNLDVLRSERWCVAGATPGGIYGTLKKGDLFDTHLGDALVLDEASQMSLPEAAMAALPLRPDGHLIVVGDHRQMPPIVQHDWEREPRRTFQQYRAYESLFLSLLPLNPPIIRFEESFRLHADMAEFLRREVYAQDGIAYFSRKQDVLDCGLRIADCGLTKGDGASAGRGSGVPNPQSAIRNPQSDAFLPAVLSPNHPLVIILHDEAGSQQRNPFEQSLLAPILHALAAPDSYALDAATGLGVVVPHRAQRADLQRHLPALTVVDPHTGAITRSAVDTVERFQGGERDVILISATESDRDYLLASSQFLLDPRRLTVALSRAKKKLILVASRTVFTLFTPDEETFAHSQLWKNLLRRTCTVPLWQGEWEGTRVEVWGNVRE